MPQRIIDNGRSATFSLDYEAGPDGADAQRVVLYEGKEIVVDPTGGATQYSVTDATVVPLDPPNAAYDYARLRVKRTSGTSVDDSRRYLYYSQFGTDPDDDGVPATGFLCHMDVFLCKIANAALFEMIAQTGETFTVYAEWLKRG